MTKNRICRRCRNAQTIGSGLSLCLNCSTEEENREIESRQNEDHDFQIFMELPEEERWRELWDAIRELRS